MAKRLKFWGWGYEGDELSEAERRFVLDNYAKTFGVADFDWIPVPAESDIALRKPRLAPPQKLAALCSTAQHDRLTHTYGKSFPDAVKTFAKDFANAPDVVAYARSEDDIAAVFDWAAGAKAAVIPFGGGTSVVGGVEPVVPSRFAGTVSLDLTGLDKVLELDRTSRCARIQGGIRVPALEAALKDKKLTLRHFPQSFEMATLGGMIATRSGGHFATLYTHIDDFVESTRSLAPSGVLESRRLPGSGAGPSPDRFMMGAEGALGVITEAWMRLQDRPTFRAAAAVFYKDIYAGAEAIRAISQSGLFPSNVRLLDPAEARMNGFGDGARAVMVLAFESADHPLDAWMARALAIARELGGEYDEAAAKNPDSHKEGAAGAWRNAFIRMPYNREIITRAAVLNDTFETAITWDRFRRFHDEVKAAVQAAIREATGRDGVVTCRFTHVYPDGPAPYFTFHCLSRHGALLEHWRHVKQAASDAVIREGGTITHHHAVGRDHMPWYVQQRPALFGEALAAAKARLDPAGTLNPGVIVPA